MTEDRYRSKILWRDSMDTWPSVRVSLQLAPWQWRLSWWQDFDLTPSFAVQVGPLSFDVMANRSPFDLERSVEVR